MRARRVEGDRADGGPPPGADHRAVRRHVGRRHGRGPSAASVAGPITGRLPASPGSLWRSHRSRRLGGCRLALQAPGRSCGDRRDPRRRPPRSDGPAAARVRLQAHLATRSEGASPAGERRQHGLVLCGALRRPRPERLGRGRPVRARRRRLSGGGRTLGDAGRLAPVGSEGR